MCPESAVPTIAAIGNAIACCDRVAHYLHAQSEAAAFWPSGQRICRMHGAHQLHGLGAEQALAVQLASIQQHLAKLEIILSIGHQPSGAGEVSRIRETGLLIYF